MSILKVCVAQWSITTMVFCRYIDLLNDKPQLLALI